MTDGKSYTVTYTAQDEAKTQSSAKFTATDGTIADFALSTTSITANKATTIKYSALDAKGIVIYEKEITNKPTGIEIDVTCDNGYTDGAKLVLMTAGNTAKVVVTYHTYKYDNEGNETGVIKKEFTVTAVEDNASASQFNYTIVNSTDTPSWENVTVNTKLAMNDSGKAAKFQIKDTNGEDITSSCGYSVESSNNNVVIAAGKVNDAAGVSLVPVAEGSAYLILKDDGKTITTLPITVVAKRIVANFSLDKSAVAISSNAALADPGSVSIGFTAKDQYGADISVHVATPECKSMPSSTATAPTVAISGNKITIATTNATKGTYNYTVTATDNENKTQTRSFAVNVVDPSGTKSYVLQFVDGSGAYDGKSSLASLDTTISNNTAANDQVISVNIATKQSGVIVAPLALTNTVSVSAIKVVGSDGTVYATSGAGITPVSHSAIDASEVTGAVGGTNTTGHLFNITAVDENGKNFIKQLPAGSYTVTVTLKDSTGTSTTTSTITGTFKITDAQPALTASVLATTTDESNIKNVIANKDYVKFVYGGVTQLDSNGASLISAGDVKAVYGKKNGNTCVVNKVTVTVDVPGNNSNTVDITIPINRVFTTTTNWDNTTLIAP